jgi:osmotically-inducible protein OsmY
MKIRTASALVCLGLLAVAACTPEQQAQPTVSSPIRNSEVTFDSQGRVVRPRSERNWDDAVGKRVEVALGKADSTAFKGVSVRAWDGGILLTGAVAKPEQRRRAAEAARTVEGVSQVFDELVLSETPANPMYVPNAHMENVIYAGLLGNDAINGAYTVRVVNGVAYLQGTTKSKADVDKAAEFARGFEGVKWVVDRVSVR